MKLSFTDCVKFTTIPGMSDLENKLMTRVSFPKRGMRHYWALSGLLFLLAVFCVPCDIALAKLFHFNNLRGDLLRVLILSEFFAHGFGVLVILTGIALMIPYKRRYLPRLALCAFFPAGMAQLIKMTGGRLRPHEFDGELPARIAETWTGWFPGAGRMGLNLQDATQSMPSAHTATAVGFAIGLCWVFPRGKYLFLPLAILASLQRIVFEAHWSSDVLLGAGIAVMMAGALTQNWGLGYFCNIIEKRGLRKLLSNEILLAETHDFAPEWHESVQFAGTDVSTSQQPASKAA